MSGPGAWPPSGCPPPGYGPPGSGPSGFGPPGYGPSGFGPPGYGPPGYGPPGPPPRPPASGLAITGRVLSFLGITAGVGAVVLWLLVAMFALGNGPLCVECMRSWSPPVGLGVLGSGVAVAIWTIALITQWRRPLLLVWSLLGWPVLFYANVYAIQGFATLFD